MDKIKKLKRVVVKEELVALTGKVEQAIILNQFIYWSERVRDIDKYLQEEAERIRKFSDGSVETEADRLEALTNGWIYKTAAEMKDECMFEKSATTMERIISSLVDNGWLDRRRNPKYKWDKTYQYRVNIVKIQQDLIKLGYTLEGYSLGEINPKNEAADTSLQNEDSKVQNEDSKVQNEDSYLHFEAAIPEITTETTKNIIKINLSIQDMIGKLDLPGTIKTVLQKQIDRLIDSKINPLDIELHYHATKDTYVLSEYTYVLNALLEKMTQSPDNFQSVLNDWLKRNREKQNETVQKKSVIRSTPVREEIVPEWISDKQAAPAKLKTNEEKNEDFLERKKKLQAKLKNKYGKTAK